MIPALIAGGVALANIAGNMYAAQQDKESRREGRQKLTEMKDASDNDYTRMLNDVNSYYSGRGSLGTLRDVNDYKKAIAGYNPDDFTYTPEQTFDKTYTKTRDDFLNPYYQQIIGDAAEQVQHTAAGAGIGRGSAAAYQIAKTVAEKQNELYKEAQAEYKDDRQFAYNEYQDYIKNMQENLDRKRAATDTKLSLQGNLANDYFNVMDQAQADKIKVQQDKLATGAQYGAAMAGLY